jgi:hypothetical protein
MYSISDHKRSKLRTMHCGEGFVVQLSTKRSSRVSPHLHSGLTLAELLVNFTVRPYLCPATPFSNRQLQCLQVQQLGVQPNHWRQRRRRNHQPRPNQVHCQLQVQQLGVRPNLRMNCNSFSAEKNLKQSSLFLASRPNHAEGSAGQKVDFFQ